MLFDTPWQELVFAIGGFAFFVALLPSIFSDEKPAFATSFTTALILSLFTFAFYTLDMWLSAAGQAFVTTAWWTLCVQSWLRR